MKKPILVLSLLVLLTIPFCGCIGDEPSTDEQRDRTNYIQLIKFVGTTHQYWNPDYVSDTGNGWGTGQECTDDYFWVDVRNLGINTLYDLDCYVTSLPDGWKLEDIKAVPEYWYSDLKCVFNDATKQIKIIRPQYDKESETYYDERYTTCMLRFRVSTGIKGGYDTDGDGLPDTMKPGIAVIGSDPDVEKYTVGYWPGEYKIVFHVDSEKVRGDAVVLKVVIQDDSNIESNHESPYNSRSFIPVENRPKDSVSDRPGAILFEDYSYAIIVILIAVVSLIIIWSLKLYIDKPRRR